MSPHRPATEKQLVALTKARAALAKRHICERCGAYDPSHGLQKDDGRIYTTMCDGVMHRYCISCRIYFRWLDDRHQIEAHLQALFEQQASFWLLDTETTGKKPEHTGFQVVEIAVVNQDGQVLYQSLCKPDIAMPASASEISGLTDTQLADVPTFVQIWPDLVQLLTSTDVPLYCWGADFDHQALLATTKRFQLPVPKTISDKTRWRCMMSLHARWYGEWSNGRNTYRWQSLEGGPALIWSLKVKPIIGQSAML
jgi:DNA polymerase III epsilon subunit-like protein